MTFCKNHRAALLALAAGLGALCLFWALRGSRIAMDWWLSHISMPFKQGISALVDPLPFSVCELGATALILLELCLLLYHRRPAEWALHLAVLLVWGYAAVCAFWGTQYYGAGFAERAGMEAPAVSAGQLAAVAEYYAERVNATAPLVPRGAEGCFAVETDTILAAARKTDLFAGAAARWPFLAGPKRCAKPAFYSRLMSAWGFTGYLCPLVGESTVNVDSPAVFLPVTVCHELAHQRGVAAEQEANFVGIWAATQNDDPVYQYSGWLFGYLHLSNALYQADPQRASAQYQTLCRQAQADLANNNAYWASWEGTVSEVGEKVYTAFLESYDQTMGMKSYGACVDLLVEETLPYTTCSTEK